MSTCKIRLLIMDLLFPNLHGRWRTVEVNYFLTHSDFDTDIYINPFQDNWMKNYTGDTLIETFHKYYRTYPYLNDYNILIFNPHYNLLNEFNKNIDGTKFNGQYPGDFLFTRRLDINWSEYDIGYSIFLCVRNSNRWLIERKLWPSICKIYPGGGFVYDENAMIGTFRQMDSNNEIAIVTQDFIKNTVSKHMRRVFTVYGAPLISEIKPLSKPQHLELNLCFTSLGFHPKKGFDNYVNLAKYFQDVHYDGNIIFHVVGLSYKSNYPSNMVFHEVLDGEILDKFYYDNIDVIVSPVKAFNDPDGFPLGGEAMLKGCIPLQCDPHNANMNYGFDDTNSLTMTQFDLNMAVKFVDMLYRQPDIRKQMSDAVIKKAFEIFSPIVQLDPITKILKCEVITNKPIYDRWVSYLDRYPDLRQNGIITQKQAISHYLRYGKFEGRIFN